MMKGLFLIFMMVAAALYAEAQPFSFESEKDCAGWTVDRGSIGLTDVHYKFGSRALRIGWEAGACVESSFADGLEKASSSKNGGMNLWVYNEVPVDADMVFSFKDAGGEEVCRLPFHLDFKGWRCIWARFVADMGKKPKVRIDRMEMLFPEGCEGGVTCLDLLEFTPRVNWQAMSDAQYKIHRTDFSLVMDFMRYREAEADTDNIIRAEESEIALIGDRLTDWYLGTGDWTGNALVSHRMKGEKAFIAEGLKRASEIVPAYDDVGNPVGEPLFQMGAPDRIGGVKVRKFRNFNEYVLLPLALDFRKNGNAESLEKAQFIYDWFHDQGWADGSAMGTLTFEKLRSGGYFHSFYLLKDFLDSGRRERETASMNWFTIFGMCNDFPEYKGEVADNLRALAIPKLAYALSLGGEERQAALTAYKRYMDNALGLAPGYYGTFKKDFSGYHHRGPYNSAYYPHALYAGAQAAYLLHDTPYALSDETMENLKNGLLAFRFFCAGLDVPAGTVGRFPKGTQVLQELVPAFAYAALCYDEPDRELVAAMKAILAEAYGAFREYASEVKSTLAYTASVGEMELVAKAASSDIMAANPGEGNVFMPYSGLLISKDEDFHFNAKGYSRYIWDFESSATENLYGRYFAYGHLEYYDFRNGRRSFNPEKEGFDWNLIPGTTSIVLPHSLLEGKGGAFAGHRNFSDQSFLAGVDCAGGASVFAVRLHDINYNPSFKADKSVFFFDDFLVCLGSGISDNDAEHKTVTSLFQAFDGLGKQVKEGTVVSDGSLTYAVKEGNLSFNKGENGYSNAFIDHGAAPEDAGYEYYIVKDGGRKAALELLGRKSPVRVLRRDAAAHIVSYKDAVCAALFDESAVHEGMVVSKVNVPLAYVLEAADGGYSLSVCEPDMRRAFRNHMGELTDADVVDEERSFRTQMTLVGEYEVRETDSSRKASGAVLGLSPLDLEVRYEEGNTVIVFTTVRAENHRFELIRK